MNKDNEQALVALNTLIDLALQTARQQQAAAQAPAMADLDFADLSRLGQVGAAREAQQAAELQDQIRR